VKKDMVSQYLKQAPNTFRVSKPQTVFDMTRDPPVPGQREAEPFRDETTVVLNDPIVNEVMIKLGKSKI
jgi:hypothetical protein